MTIDELIKRLEAADGPNRELDRDILEACDWRILPDIHGRPLRWIDPNGARHLYDVHPTASVDVASMLVPDGMYWTVSSDNYARVVGDAYEPDVDVTGGTPAIALSIAALKARQSGK